jgi:hypothetical protein
LPYGCQAYAILVIFANCVAKCSFGAAEIGAEGTIIFGSWIVAGSREVFARGDTTDVMEAYSGGGSCARGREEFSGA